MNGEMPTPGIAEAEQLAASGKLVDAELAFVRAIYASKSPEALNKYAAFLKQEGHLEPALKNFEEAIQSGQAATRPRAEAYRGAAGIYHQLHDLGKAEKYYKAALAIDSALDLEESLAEDHRALGHLALDQGRLATAETNFERALKIDSDFANQPGKAADKTGLGGVLLSRGELDRAEAMFHEALAASEGLNRNHDTVGAYLGLASIAERRSEWVRAAVFYQKAVEWRAEPRDLEAIASGLLHQGAAYLRAGANYLELARNRLMHARRIYEDLDSASGAAQASIHIAEVFRLEGKFSEAEQALLKAIKLDEKLGDRKALATAYGELGKLYRQTGALDRARSMWTFARSLYLQNNDPSGAAR